MTKRFSFLNTDKVREFLQRAGHLNLPDIDLQVSLIEEEYQELLDAVERYREVLGSSDTGGADVLLQRAWVAKETADLIYVAVGLAWILGFGETIPDVFNIVSEANLDKVRQPFWTTGRGKVLKTHPGQSKETVYKIYNLFVAKNVNRISAWARLVYRLARVVGNIPGLPSKVYTWMMRVQVWYVRKSFEKSIDAPVSTQEKGEQP